MTVTALEVFYQCYFNVNVHLGVVALITTELTERI